MMKFFKRKDGNSNDHNQEDREKVQSFVDRIVNILFSMFSIALTITILAYLIAEAPNKDIVPKLEKRTQEIMNELEKIKNILEAEIQKKQEKQVIKYDQREIVPIRTKPATTTTIILENENITNFSVESEAENKPFKTQISKNAEKASNSDTLILETAENSSGAKGKLRIFTEKGAEFIFYITTIDSKSAENPAGLIIIKAESAKREAAKTLQADYSSSTSEEIKQNQENKE